MIEVLHLIDTYRIGGPGKTIINAARFIDQRRYRVHVASFTSPDAGRNEFAAAARSAGIPVLELPETRRFNFSHIALLKNYVRSQGVRILHMHGYRTDVLGYVALFRDPVALVTTHHGWIRNNARQALFVRMAMRLCTRFHGVELVSERLRDELPAAFRHSPRVSVVRNGVVLEDYTDRGRRADIRSRLGVPAGEPLLGVIGRLSIEKGCLEMVEAFALIAARRPDARLVFIGEGPLQAQTLARVESLGLGERVRLVPHQPDIRAYFEAIDVLVSPSRTEGLSNVILEALAAGRPVVATRVGGNAEIITAGESGLLVEARQPPALADAVVRVLDDAELARRLVQGGSSRVRDEFSFETRMRREERFYDQCLSRVTSA